MNLNYKYFYGTMPSNPEATAFVAEFKDLTTGKSFCSKTVTVKEKGDDTIIKRAYFYELPVLQVIQEDVKGYVLADIEDFVCEDARKEYFLKDLKIILDSLSWNIEYHPEYSKTMNVGVFLHNMKKDFDQIFEKISGVAIKASTGLAVSSAVLKKTVGQCIDNTGLEEKLILGKYYIIQKTIPATSSSGEVVYVIDNNGEELSAFAERFKIDKVANAFKQQISK